MTLSIKVAGATFSKFVDVAFAQASSLLGLYEFQGATPTKNRVSSGSALTVVGAPQFNATGVVVGDGAGFDTGIIRPAGDFTFAALVRGIAAIGSTNGVLFVNEFDGSQVAGSSNGNHLGYRGSGTAGNRGVAGFFGQNANSTGIVALVPVNTFDITKHYLMAQTRIGLNIKTYLFDVGRNPTTAATVTPSAETVARSIRIGDYVGANNGALAGTGEVVGAGIWSRGLAQTDLQAVYDYYAAKAPLLGITLA